MVFLVDRMSQTQKETPFPCQRRASPVASNRSVVGYEQEKGRGHSPQMGSESLVGPGRSYRKTCGREKEKQECPNEISLLSL